MLHKKNYNIKKVDIEQIKTELEKLQTIYQRLIDSNIPENGNIQDIDEEIKQHLLSLRSKIHILRKKISHTEKLQDEDIAYLEKLRKKFN